MADKEHAEWAANRKAQKDAKKRAKEEREELTPPSAPAEDSHPSGQSRDDEDSNRVSLGM